MLFCNAKNFFNSSHVFFAWIVFSGSPFGGCCKGNRYLIRQILGFQIGFQASNFEICGECFSDFCIHKPQINRKTIKMEIRKTAIKIKKISFSYCKKIRCRTNVIPMKHDQFKKLALAVGGTPDGMRKLFRMKNFPKRKTARALERATSIPWHEWLVPEKNNPWDLLSENWDKYEPRILAACQERVSSNNNKITEASNGKE